MMDGWMDRQMERQTDRQTYEEIETDVLPSGFFKKNYNYKINIEFFGEKNIYYYLLELNER